MQQKGDQTLVSRVMLTCVLQCHPLRGCQQGPFYFTCPERKTLEPCFKVFAQSKYSESLETDPWEVQCLFVHIISLDIWTQQCKKSLWVLIHKGFLLRTFKRFLTGTEVTPRQRGRKIKAKKYLSCISEYELIFKADNRLTNKFR